MEENTSLESRVLKIENNMKVIQNLVPKTNLMSHSFIKRAFAIMGHYIIASLIIVIPFYLIIFIIVAKFWKGSGVGYGY